MAKLARRYELPFESLEFHHLSLDDGVMIFLDEEAAIRVYNEGRPLQLPPYIVCFRWWSRLKNTSVVVRPSSIDVVLSGIPTHA